MKKLFLLFAILLTATTAHAQMEKGYRGFVEIGHNFGTGKYEDYYWSKEKNIILISTTHGYQLNQLLFVGAGFGFGMWKVDGDFPYDYDRKIYVSTPYLEVRFDFPSMSRINFFETNKIGASIGHEVSHTCLFFAPSIGARYQVNNNFGLSFSLGYQFGGSPYSNGIKKINGLTISLGVDFQP